MASYQTQFHQQWAVLSDPHVRAMAWLLTSPDLLDPYYLPWRGRIAHPGLPPPEELRAWLLELDARPALFHQALQLEQQHRMGRYAESLLEYYLKQVGVLYARGIQIRNELGRTLGELDFLLHDQHGLLHLELACKLFLCLPEATSSRLGAYDLTPYVGAGLQDSFAEKLDHLLEHQLPLAQSPETLRWVPERIRQSQGLVKGWLFYRDLAQSRAGVLSLGVAQDHCRGLIWKEAELLAMPIEHVMLLDRTHGLAPVQVRADQTQSLFSTGEMIRRHFSGDRTPILLAIMKRRGDCFQESERGYVVSDEWLEHAQGYVEKLRQRANAAAA